MGMRLSAITLFAQTAKPTAIPDCLDEISCAEKNLSYVDIQHLLREARTGKRCRVFAVRSPALSSTPWIKIKERVRSLRPTSHRNVNRLEAEVMLRFLPDHRDMVHFLEKQSLSTMFIYSYGKSELRLYVQL